MGSTALHAPTPACALPLPPSSLQAKIFNLFTNLLLLQKGKILYQGVAQEALTFFAASGFPCPTHENPADHFLGA